MKISDDKIKAYEERTLNWFYCDNIVHPKHHLHVGLLSMNFPRVFIYIRNLADATFASYEDFKKNVAEVNFFDPKDRETANLEEILIDAYNFMILQERKEDEMFGEADDEFEED